MEIMGKLIKEICRFCKKNQTKGQTKSRIEYHFCSECKESINLFVDAPKIYPWSLRD